MKTIELFAGIGGFRIASEKRGIQTIWANDILHEACEVYKDNFGSNELVEGDIRTLVDEVPPHDLLTGGFPCQPFSNAGKKKGISDPRGTLFKEIVRVLQKHQPQYFILENVKRLLAMEHGFHFATILSALAELDYRIEWRLLNAKDFGLPQNRQRVVLFGTHLRGYEQWDNVDEIKLATSEDLIELSDNELDVLGQSNIWKPIENHSATFPTWGIACKGRFFGADLEMFSLIQKAALLRSVLQEDAPSSFDLTEETLPRLQHNAIVEKYVGGVEILSNQAGGARMGYTIFGINGLAPTLTSSTSRHYERYKVGDKYRRLTNIEYARIQGFPDHHCRVANMYYQYFLYGNAVPPPLVGWVMDRMLARADRKTEARIRHPLTLFANASI